MSLKTTTILDGQLSSCIWIKKEFIKASLQDLNRVVPFIVADLKGKDDGGLSPIKFMSLETASTILKCQP